MTLEIPDVFDRRLLLKLSLTAGIAGALGTDAVGQSKDAPALLPQRPTPTVDARFPVALAPGVYMLPDKRIPLVPNIGIVVGTESVLVVDCGLGIESAESVLRFARELAPGRRIILTVTHAHPEHGFGAQVFRKDARIFYNAAQHDHLMRSGKALLDGFRAVVLPAAQRSLLDGLELTPPHETYDGPETVLDLGGRQVHLRTWGTAHSPGDQIVFLPQESILFAGDLLEERMFPIVPFFPPMIAAADIDIARWEVVLNDILQMQPRVIVPGHRNLAGAELPQAVLGYFGAIRDLVAQRNVPENELPARVRAAYPTWENGEFIAPTLAYFRSRT